MTDITGLHSSDSNEHFTPAYIVEAARLTMVGIDLDPFSCRLANTVVKSSAFFSDMTDGFGVEWHGRVFVNPPGGKVGRESSQALAWRKLMAEYAARRVDQAIFVCFNLGFLQVSQSGAGPYPTDFPIAYPKSRVAYLVDHLPGPTPKQPKRKPSAKQLADFAATGLCEGDSPPGASCVVYVGSDAAAFVREFSSIGRVVVPMAQSEAA